MNMKIRNLLAKFNKDQRGLSTVEYVLLLVLLVIMCVGVWNTFGRGIARKLADAGTQFNNNTMTATSKESVDTSSTVKMSFQKR